MTPAETARKIIDEHFWKDPNRIDWTEDGGIEKLTADICEALQHESNAQLDRDRAVIDAAKKACQVYHDAWKIADDERMLLRKSVELLRWAMKERTEDSQPHE